MPKITDERREARRRQILQAARTCFLRSGLHLTTMDDIIREAGLSAGAVYSYFTGKDDLVLAAIATSMADLKAQVAPILSADPPLVPAELVRQVTAAIDAASTGFDLRRIALLGWAEAQRRPDVLALLQGVYRELQDALLRAVARRSGGQPEDRAVAETIFALILGHVVQSALGLRAGPPPLAGSGHMPDLSRG